MRQVSALFIFALIVLQALWMPAHLVEEDHDQHIAHSDCFEHTHSDEHEDDSSEHSQHSSSDHDFRTTLINRSLPSPASVFSDMPPARVVCMFNVQLKLPVEYECEFRPPGETENLVINSRAPPAV